MTDNAGGLTGRWRELRRELDGAGVALLAVSKYADDAAVAELVRAGQQDFAESRPQRLRDRALAFPSARWHMIGPLQKNKAKYIARHAAAWHSLEDVDTARAVAGHVQDRHLPVLVQLNLGGIEHQHGVAPDALPALLREVMQLSTLRLAGLMCMAPRDGDARDCFDALRRLRDSLQKPMPLPAVEGGEDDNIPFLPPGRLALCMGMSGDYRLAIDEGADIVRIGSGLFDIGG